MARTGWCAGRKELLLLMVPGSTYCAIAEVDIEIILERAKEPIHQKLAILSSLRRFRVMDAWDYCRMGDDWYGGRRVGHFSFAAKWPCRSSVRCRLPVPYRGKAALSESATIRPLRATGSPAAA